ncbi:hypothetical protein MUP59_07405 [Candidatus Bathyarchaeota archaeon]|nr:hypothetical protein [Candidatus Bathyarchaeota archaeon]
MMRTIEILLVIIIMTGAFVIASIFAVLPSPRQVSPTNLERLALTTLQALDGDHDLSETIFKPSNDSSWTDLQVALSASLPPNMVYNLTVYEVQPGNTQLYQKTNSISNAQSLGVSTGSSSYLVASSNVTFSFTPEKIGERGGGGTLYILNCSDSNGWWITGYTAQKLAEDLYELLSPYFQSTIMVQNTTQFGDILNGTEISASPYENVSNAVIINTCGEAVPVPSGYYAGIGSQDSYAKYCYILGQRVKEYNWTFASIVGYPLYYVSNTGLFPSSHNTYGIYGMQLVGAAGLNSFLQGLDNQPYVYNSNWITADLAGSVYLSSEAIYSCNYYGIYPSYYQPASRALPSSIASSYHLSIPTYIFNPSGGYLAGAVFKQATSGAFLSLGLTRTPDIRLTALGLLAYYRPRLYRSDFTSAGTSRLVILQLGQMGGA